MQICLSVIYGSSQLKNVDYFFDNFLKKDEKKLEMS